jgi:3D (Asp-Asp-Asp) domain-containing protein
MRMTSRISMLIVALVVAAAIGCGGAQRTAPPTPPHVPSAPAAGAMEFEATAYSVTGTTASGIETGPGIVAADPKILPLGSRIRVSEAGPYSGVYTVSDTGRTVKGHEIDIFISKPAEAKRFGRKRVRIEILERGEERAQGS